MRYFKHLAFLLIVLCTSQLWAVNFSKTLGDAGIDDGGSSAPIIQTTKSAADPSANKGLATLSGNGYVGVYSSLNVRDAVWGNIIGSLTNNEPVSIIGTEGDWYKISYQDGTGYVHARYIFNAKDKRYRGDEVTSANRGGSAEEVILNVPGTGSSQARVVSAANSLVSKYSSSGSFPYAPATQGGSLGCAQVVSTALKNAGVPIGVDLSCLSVKGKLQNIGYKTVSAPPFQAGDVIFWSTYDSTGDGRKDPDTHIGIVMTSGNSAQAMSNSSSQKRPRIHSATYAPVTTVLRKA